MDRTKQIIVAVLGIAVLGAAAYGVVAEDSAGTECEQGPVTTESGLTYENVECGEGEAAEKGDVVQVHYTVMVQGGEAFDSSRGRDPLELTLGSSDVLPAFEEGITGMSEGGERKLVLPPELAYGPQGGGPVPPNATVVFDVELVDIQQQ